MGKRKESDADQKQFWQMVLETFQSSGLSVRNFCKQEGISEPAFYSWRRKLSDNNSQRSEQGDAKPSAFVEVSIPQNSSVLELLLSSGNTLRIHPGTDNKTLSNVLSVLRESGLC